MDRDALSNEYYKLLHQYDYLARKLSNHEKILAAEWLRKLQNSNSSIEEEQLRNYFLSYLVRCMNSGVFNEVPFNAPPPPCGNLLVLQSLLPADHRCACLTPLRQKLITQQMFSISPVASAFLCRQPVPKRGSFSIYYLTLDR